jgi:hypothetical protein
MSHEPSFRGGRNIALKVPPHQFAATAAFYRDVLGLAPIPRLAPDLVFEFGGCQLWIDRVPGLSQAEIWLEVVTDDLPSAERRLAAAGTVRCDEIEALPEGFPGFWVSTPAAIIHLIAQADEPPAGSA